MTKKEDFDKTMDDIYGKLGLSAQNIRALQKNPDEKLKLTFTQLLASLRDLSAGFYQNTQDGHSELLRVGREQLRVCSGTPYISVAGIFFDIVERSRVDLVAQHSVFAKAVISLRDRFEAGQTVDDEAAENLTTVLIAMHDAYKNRMDIAARVYMHLVDLKKGM